MMWQKPGDEKVSKKDAHYTPKASDMNDRCALCLHYLGKNECEKVISPVATEGWCRYFKRKKH